MTNLKTTSARYHPGSVFLHWLMAGLLAAAVVCIELHEFFPKGDATRANLQRWHFMLGLMALLLAILRIALRLARPAPQHKTNLQGKLARGMQWLMYVLMLALPVLGWAALSARGRPVPFFFDLQWPALLEPNRPLARVLKEIHETGGNLGLWLVGAHTLAALAHHYILKMAHCITCVLAQQHPSLSEASFELQYELTGLPAW